MCRLRTSKCWKLLLQYQFIVTRYLALFIFLLSDNEWTSALIVLQNKRSKKNRSVNKESVSVQKGYDMDSVKILNSNFTGFSVKPFSVFEVLTGLPEDNDELIVIIVVAIAVLMISCCMSPSWHFLPKLAYLFVFLLSWIAGVCIKKFSEEYDLGVEQPALAANGLRVIIPVLVFHRTLNIDYHTLGRVIGPVLLISFCLFIANTGLSSLVMYSISRQGTIYSAKLIHALNLSLMSCSHAVEMLEKAQIQVRQLQILLQGEMLISIALFSYLNNIVLKYRDFNQIGQHIFAGSSVVFSIWSLVGIFPGMLASYLFRQFVSYSYDDGIGQAACCLAFNVILFSVCSSLGTNGTLSVLAYGICLGASKIKFNTRTAAFYKNSHDFENYASSMLVFSYCGLWIGLNPNKFEYFDASYVFIVFASCLISRMITFILIHRTVAKINLQVNWKHITIAVQSPARGALVLAYTLVYITNDRLECGRSMLVDNVIIVCLSYIVNLALMGPVLGMIGMYDLTRAKIVNMNLAMSQVNECRTRAIQSLKVDRVIADANWIVVDQSTKIQHPYKKNIQASLDDEDADFENKGQSRVVYCGECGAKGTAPLSKQEMEDVALDIKHRILKAQRVSFYRQHDNGTLSRHGVKVLSNLVEKVLVREDPILTAKDLKLQREGSARMQCLKRFFRNLFTITSKKHAFIPTFWIRAVCFRLCTSRKYQITMTCLSMVDLFCLFRLLNLYYGGYLGNHAEAKLWQMVHIFFFSIFFIEFIIEILGIGVIQYFYSPVNQVEFSCSCLIRTAELGMFLNLCLESGVFENILVADEIIAYLKTILILRVTRVYVFVVALIPKILNLVDRKMDEDLMKSYDIGKAYLITQEQVMKFLGHLVTNDEVYNSLSKVLEADRLVVSKELGLITFDRTTIATTNKTGHAIRNVVHTMNDCINSMKEEEYLDPLETAALVNALEKVVHRARSLNLIEPLEPHLIVTEVPWLKNDNSTLNFLLKHVRISSYCQEELIIDSGDDPCGMMIIIEGLVRVTYVPSVVATDLNARYGVLPNYDFFMNLKFQQPQEDYVTTNAVIGEIGVVTGRKYNMKAICETSVHLLWFPMKILRAVIHDAGNHLVFQSALWKSIGIKLAVNLLQDAPQFRGWSREKLFMYLQGGVVPVLKEVHSVYVGEYISDVILIEGIAMDHATRLTFIAPYYIPRTVATLLLPGSPLMDIKSNYSTKLFIIPNFHSDADDVSGPDGLFKEYIHMMERESLERDRDFSGRSSSKIVGKEECKRGHGRSKMSAYTRRVLKAQKKTMKAIKFMEYIPTVNGPIERNLTSTTFLLAEKKRAITQAIYPKTKYYDPSFAFVGDVAENSEIREMKTTEDDDEDGRRGARRSGAPKRSTSRNLSSIGSLSSSRMTVDADGSVGEKTHVEIHLIESSEDEIEKYESKEAQTSIKMANHSPTKSSSKSSSIPSLASSDYN